MTPRKRWLWELGFAALNQRAKTFVLTSYLDDAGHYHDPNETITCIGGCVSTNDAWDELRSEWNAVLQDKRFDVPWLHMSAYERYDPPFDKWKGEEHKEMRIAFLSSLMDIMARRVMAVVGATVPNADFAKLTVEQKALVKDPYFLCLQETFHASAVIPYKSEEKVDVIFSDQQQNRERTENLFKYMKSLAQRDPEHPMNCLGKFDWGSYKKDPALQAADLVAYELRSFASLLVSKEKNKVRMPMKRLFSDNYFFSFFDHNVIIKRFYFGGQELRRQMLHRQQEKSGDN